MRSLRRCASVRVRGCELGFTQGDIADLLGVSQETVSRWWTAYIAGGLGAIPGDRTGRPVGSGRTLSDEQARHIQDLIDDHSPEESGHPRAAVEPPGRARLIRQEFGIAMAVRTVGEYLKRWGYTAKVPRRHAGGRTPRRCGEWLEETYPAIAARAGGRGPRSTGATRPAWRPTSIPGYGYAREGDPATMEVPDTHIRINQISAISNEGTVRFMTYKGSMDAALFIGVPGPVASDLGAEDLPDRGPLEGP